MSMAASSSNSNQCRTCYIKNNSKKMTTIESLKEYSNDMCQLLTFLDVEVAENIANVLCSECVKKLQSILDFKNQCLYMRSMLITNFVNIENIDAGETKMEIKLEKVKDEPEDTQFDDDINISDNEKSSCDEKSNTKNNRISNEDNLESDKSTNQCTLCLKNFQSVSNLARHKATIHNLEENMFPCQLCSKILYTHSDLERHIAVFHDATCKICNKKFNNVRYLRIHDKACHQIDEGDNFCTECKRFFRNNFIYNKHMRDIHQSKSSKIACTLCGLMVDNLKYHMTRQHTDSIKCEFCDKELKNQDTLRSHIRLIHENKAIKKTSLCSTCGKVISGNLIQHRRMKHSNERNFKCQYCEKTYKTSSHQRKHERIEHLKERPYKCEYCSRSFGEKYILIGHIRTHTGEKPYVCHICTKAFALKVTLTTHIKLMHGSELK